VTSSSNEVFEKLAIEENLTSSNEVLLLNSVNEKLTESLKTTFSNETGPLKKRSS